MRRSLTAAAVWLALGTGAAALAPAADLVLTPKAGLEPTWPASKELHAAARVVEEGVEELHAAARVVEEGVESLWKRPAPEPPAGVPGMTVELARELNAAAQAAEAGEHAAAQSGSGVQVSAQHRHSHSVLKELIAAAPALELAAEDELEAQAASMAQASPAQPSEVLAQPSQSEPQQRQVQHLRQRQVQAAPPAELLSGWGRSAPGGEFCAGRPIYDGPTASMEDCRERCTGPCRFWSYWRDSAAHRCKLTAECGQRERDVRHDVAVTRRVLGATDEGADRAAWGPGPQKVQWYAPELNQTCSPRGSARKLDGSPDSSSWYNLGKTHSYVDCANTAASMAYRNLVWNVGSTANGRCYGFNSDLPGVLQPSCEDTYCWLFGPACESAGQGGKKEGQNLISAKH